MLLLHLQLWCRLSFFGAELGRVDLIHKEEIIVVLKHCIKSKVFRPHRFSNTYNKCLVPHTNNNEYIFTMMQHSVYFTQQNNDCFLFRYSLLFVVVLVKESTNR